MTRARARAQSLGEFALVLALILIVAIVALIFLSARSPGLSAPVSALGT